MKVLEILIIAIALSLDAFITMTANYSAYKNSGLKGKVFAVLLISSLHSLFALVGYFISTVSGLSDVKFFEYAVILLYLFLAVKVLFDKGEEGTVGAIDGKKCFAQALVTSADAFVGGITLSVTKGVAFLIATGIFLVTLVMVILGLALGRFLESKPKGFTKVVSATLFLALSVKSIIM